MTGEEERHGLGERKACLGYPETASYNIENV